MRRLWQKPRVLSSLMGVIFATNTLCDPSESPLLFELTELYEQKEILLQNRNRIDEKLAQIKKRQKQLESILAKENASTTSSNNKIQSMQTGEVVRIGNDIYILKAQIGQGTFGIIRKAIHQQSKKEIAIKRCPLTDKQGSMELRREIQLLQTLDTHPHIIQLLGVLETDQFLLAATEFMAQGDLFDFICQSGPLPESNVKQKIHQVLLALAHLHQHDIAHGDLKPENILIDQHQVLKLADFGGAVFPGSSDTTEARTTAYCPPELLLGSIYDYAADMWAVGCILYVLLHGKHPFDPTGRSSKGQIEAAIVTHTSVKCKKGSVLAKDLINQLLSRDRTKRLTVQQALEHPWFSS